LFSKAWGDGERAALESERGEVQREQKRKKFFDAIIAGIFPSSRIA